MKKRFDALFCLAKNIIWFILKKSITSPWLFCLRCYLFKHIIKSDLKKTLKNEIPGMLTGVQFPAKANCFNGKQIHYFTIVSKLYIILSSI